MNAQAGGNGGTPALADFIALNEEIAALVHARVPLELQLARLGRELPGATGSLAQRLSERLAAGESLDEAVAAEGRSLPAAYRVTIVAGLQSGRLAGALEALVDSASRMADLRRVTGLAIIYPMLLIVVACLLFGLMVTQFIPQFEWLHKPSFGYLTELAHSPRLVWSLAVATSVAVLLWAALWWLRSGRVNVSSTAGMGIFAGLPWVRRARYFSQSATFAELLQLLIKQDVPLDRALVLAADATDDPRLGAAAGRLATRVQSGESADELLSSGADAQIRDIPPLVRLALSQSSNRPLLTSSLRQAAELYRDRATYSAEWYTEFMPMLLTLFIGGAVTLCFALLVFWPYTSMLRELCRWNWN